MEYIVILQRAWANDSGCGVVYESDLLKFKERKEAISHGFRLRDSDDFNIGVVRNGSLVSLDWMETPSNRTPQMLDEISELIGLDYE
ncbi:antitoxin [Citrobacter braakii]|uniref:antitoxin n=1 Tax=Citrobacter braakii TaxID=57706 RepID=UPI002FDC23CE